MLLQGDQRWQASDRDFLDAWYGWRNLAKEKIEDGTEEWNRIQGNLASAQAAWITKYNDAARTASADAIRAFLNDNVDDVVNGMMKSLPGGSVIERFDIEKLKNDMLKDADTNPFSDAFMSLSQRANTAFTISEITAAQGSAMSDQATKLFDDFSAAAQMMQNMQLFETLNKLARSYESMLVKAEDSARETIRVEMEKSGFANSGGNWTRRAIYDANLWETKWKTQVVPAWQTFRYEPFTVDLVVDDGVPFDKSMLATVSQSELDALVMAAKMGLKNKWRYIYEDGKDPRSFTYWAGTFPSTEDEDGSGQYGIIFTAKVAAEKEKAEGEAKANAPFFKKGLIPGLDFSLFDFAKIGLSIAGGGPWMSLALDAAASLGTGMITGDWDAALDGMVSAVAGAAIGVGVNALGNVTTSWMGKNGIAGWITEPLVKAAQTYTTSVANGAVSAFSMSKLAKGEDAWDEEIWKKGWKNWQSAATAGVTALATSFVNEAFGGKYEERKYMDANGKVQSAGYGYAFNRLDGGVLSYANDLRKVSSFVGGLAGQTFSALTTDEGFKLNILNTRDIAGLFSLGGDEDRAFSEGEKPYQATGLFDGPAAHMGLLELSFGGKNGGMSLQYGQGGLDVSGSSIVDLVNATDTAIHHIALLNSKDGETKQAYIDFLMSHPNNKQLQDIGKKYFEGDKELVIAELGTNAYGRNIMGSHSIADNAITIDNSSLFASTNSSGKTVINREAFGYFLSEIARQDIEMGVEQKDYNNKVNTANHWAMDIVQGELIKNLNQQYGFGIGKNNDYRINYEYAHLLGLQRQTIINAWDVIDKYMGVTGRDFNTERYPVLNQDDYKLTGGFGNRLRDGIFEFHMGVDSATYSDDRNVTSTTEGVVMEYFRNLTDGTPANGYGNRVIVMNLDGTYSTYSHLEDNSVSVSIGDFVMPGDRIANMGGTGNYTVYATHLHYERWQWVAPYKWKLRDQNGNWNDTVLNLGLRIIHSEYNRKRGIY